MDQYTLVLEALEYVLVKTGRNEYASAVHECTEQWKTNHNSSMLKNEFTSNGRLYDLDTESFYTDDPERNFWTSQLLSALIALAAQGGVFIEKGINFDIDFLRRNFGADNEVMMVKRCENCGTIRVNAADIGKYASKIVIPAVLIKGLENGDLKYAAESILDLTSKNIERELRKARLRLENSRISFSDSFITDKACLRCGSKKFADCRLLRSLKENVFIPLG